MKLNKKILSLDQLKLIINKLKKREKIIVQCHGVFDVLHLGHFRHFQKAKENGDILIVTITSDKYVNKGPNQPFFSTQQRLEALSNLEIIDYVARNDDYDAVNLIRTLKPNFYCKGSDYSTQKKDVTGKIKAEINSLKSVNGRLVITDEISFSSSKLLDRNNLLFTKDQSKIVNDIKNKTSFNSIISMIENFKNLKVLIIGETIIDKYIFCEVVGKSGKDPVLILKDINEEKYLGGAAIVANHISEFTKNISFLSMIGENKEEETFIRKNLKNNIKINFIYKKNSKTISKKRFIDQNTGSKTFGVYSLNDDAMNKNEIKKINNYLKKSLSKFDLVFVYDYGHGFITRETSKIICSQSKFLALNAQINSTNIGHHTIDKYNNIDCLIINENELRHEIRNKSDDIKTVIMQLIKKINIKECVVTQGTDGAICYNHKKNFFYKCPAFASHVIDKVGAGDAFLPFYSMSSKLKYNMNFSLLLGSLAAAQSVETIGNSKSVSKKDMLKRLTHLFK